MTPRNTADSPQPWDQPTEGHVTRYGFTWGPMIVTRLCHVEGRGYSLEIVTPYQSMHVYVTEKGRKIEPMPVRAGIARSTDGV